ncbi:ryncolin-1-like [Anopheles aquasalis]|uniref:ryncolin-1-like n=1 Tax=Anopheles aquasalis TaxID=42839 RepID=UPI00215A162A|nr:ryncolin-1-like [Anopheles aquasalis]
MKLSVCFILFNSILCVWAAKDTPNSADAIVETPLADQILQYGLELVLQKLEHIDRKLLVMQFELNELREQTASNKVSHEKMFADTITAINRLENHVVKHIGRNMSVSQDQSNRSVETTCATPERFCEKWFNTTLTNNQGQGLAQHKESTWISLSSLYKSRIPTAASQREGITTTTTPSTTTLHLKLASYSSCKDVPSNVSGVYLIHVNNDSSPFKMYCEQEKFDGGWIVVQHRFNGSVDFYRNWTEYREGFGELENEFWLGLELVHQLTTARAHEIIFEIEDFSDNYGYARYNEFKIGSESEQYCLTIGKYSGTAGDAMGLHKGIKFSTMDRDNDGDNGHCAQKWASAWWYNGCSDADLNGPYGNVADGKSMVWYNFKNDIRGMSYSRMMIREL